MFYSGIADEGAEDLASQVRAHRELGWKHIELRNLSGTNLTDVTEDECNPQNCRMPIRVLEAGPSNHEH